MGRPQNAFVLDGECVKTFLEKEEMTQAELAEGLEVSSRAVQNWLNGGNGVDETTAEDLASLLRVGVGEVAAELPEDYRRRQTDARNYCKEALDGAMGKVEGGVCQAAGVFLPASNRFKLAGWPLEGRADGVDLQPSDNGGCRVGLRVFEPARVRLWARVAAGILVEYAVVGQTPCGNRGLGAACRRRTPVGSEGGQSFVIDVQGPEGSDAVIASGEARLTLGRAD